MSAAAAVVNGRPVVLGELDAARRCARRAFVRESTQIPTLKTTTLAPLADRR